MTSELVSLVPDLPASLDTFQANLDAVQAWSEGVDLVMNPAKIVVLRLGATSSVA